MEPTTGFFRSRDEAERAVRELTERGIGRERITLLIPGMSDVEVDAAVRTTDTEGPGMGSALGAVVGGASGAAAGWLGAAAASALIPGIGPIAVLGFAAMGLLGAGGAVAGAAAGEALEEGVFTGVPKDDLFLFEDALRQGRTIVIVYAEDADQKKSADETMVRNGAESIDAAREGWWSGVRGAEHAHYTADGSDFTSDEERYRRGFMAAQRPELRGRTWDQAHGQIREQYPDLCDDDAFRRGYDRGCTHRAGRDGGLNGY